LAHPRLSPPKNKPPQSLHLHDAYLRRKLRVPDSSQGIGKEDCSRARSPSAQRIRKRCIWRPLSGVMCATQAARTYRLSKEPVSEERGPLQVHAGLPCAWLRLFHPKETGRGRARVQQAKPTGSVGAIALRKIWVKRSILESSTKYTCRTVAVCHLVSVC